MISGDEEDQEAQLKAQPPLPLIAPRDPAAFASLPSSSRDVSSHDSGPRRARLSHRSRAGCWTCRGRKVKCDERHPRCGQCTRLDRECNWEHRWHFSDATEGTQIKHSNVFIAGNSVWDPSARSSTSGSESPLKAEDLPRFSDLTNDEQREQLAGVTAPGTYGVVVTPESFASLPEYSGNFSSPTVERRCSSTRLTTPAQVSPYARRRVSQYNDPNVVILDRFEEAIVMTPTLSPVLRRASLPLTVDTTLASVVSPVTRSATLPSTPADRRESEQRLVTFFRQHITYRIIPRVFDNVAGPGILSQPSLRSVFERKAPRFLPLHHAICALSALSLHYSHQARFEDAHNHYDRALAPRVSDLDMRSDGSFLRHFLLLLYDISIPSTEDIGNGTRMWEVHLVALQRIIAERARTLPSEPYGFLIWLICNLDMYASLLGNGDCAFFSEMTRTSRLPELNQQQPTDSMTTPGGLPELILELNRAIVLKTAKIAHAAHCFRVEHAGAAAGEFEAQLLPRFQSQITVLQDELVGAWTTLCPAHLNPVTVHTTQTLPPMFRAIFESSVVLFHTALIYSRTSMFPGQRMIVTPNHSDLSADTQARVELILDIAERQAARQALDQRSIIFPIFMAGFVTRQSDSKVRAIDLLATYEKHGIGSNTTITRRLLTAVCEEQSRRLAQDRPMEEVEWLQISFQRGLRISNCGL